MLRLIGSGIRSISDLAKSSGILFAANTIFNVFNLIFWLFMVRNLSTVDYGVLNSLISLYMILSLPASTFQMVVTKFISQFNSCDDKSKIKCFFYYFGKKLFLAGVGFLAIFILSSRGIANFLQIKNTGLVVITALGLFLSIITPISLGVLNGLQKFSAMAVNSIANGFTRLASGVLLVNLGYGVFGSLWSFVLASLATLTITTFYIPKKIFKASQSLVKDLELRSIYPYFLPVAVSLLCYMILTNIDVVLVKHFFNEISAGKYSVAQMIGKIILFLPGTIGIVLFPKMTEASTRKEKVSGLLLKGLILAAGLCLSAGIFCSIFPKFVLTTLTKKYYVECVLFVRLFCVAMTFYALVQILIFYFLSIRSLKFIPYLIGVTVLQVVMIIIFHANPAQVLINLSACSFLLLIIGLLNVRWGH